MRVLNLYAGIGGNRKLWTNCEVTAVEFNSEIAEVYKSFFPEDTIVVSDAHIYLQEHYQKFDFIWSSPPCQSHSKIRMMASKRGSYGAVLPNMNLYSEIIFLQHFSKCKFVVENVIPYYTPLVAPTIKLDRHLFWSNFDIELKEFEKPSTKHNKVTGTTERYGINLRGISMQHRKDQIIRNCVNPDLGLHVFNAMQRAASMPQEVGQKDSGCDRKDWGLND